MQKNASRAIRLILKHEGGYVNHPSDPGGATNMGVTLETFRRYVKPGGTIEDLKALTVEQATHVFKRQYWDKVSADDLPSGLDYAVADFAVNSGPHRAAVFLQRIVKVVDDGVIGPKTLAAAKAKPAAFIINRLCDDRLRFMQSIRGGELWKVFGKGWNARVEDVRKEALNWTGGFVRPDAEPTEPVQPSIWARFSRLWRTS